MEFPTVASRYDYVNVFFNQLAPIVVNEYVRRKGQKRLYPSTVLAMAALESGYNLKAETLFGIKDDDGKILNTTEYINGEYVDDYKDSFKIYPSLVASVQGLYDLMQWDNYDRATSCTDYEEECRMVQACGYATDPHYADKIISIVNSYQLTMFNNTEEFEINEEPQEEEPQEEEPKEEETTNDIYTVKSGDTLWAIVRDYYGYDNDTDIANKINEIVEFNDIENPNLIYAGENITLI